MAISKEKKIETITRLKDLLADSKMTAVANFQGLTVKEVQDLKKQAKESNTTITVAKNRLFKRAVQETSTLKDADVTLVTGQLIYAFNNQDEVAPVKSLSDFAKQNENLKLILAIDGSGTVLGEADVKMLADLPSKDQLRGRLVGTIGAPLSGFVNVLNGNLRGVLNVLNQRAEKVG